MTYEELREAVALALKHAANAIWELREDANAAENGRRWRAGDERGKNR